MEEIRKEKGQCGNMKVSENFKCPLWLAHAHNLRSNLFHFLSQIFRAFDCLKKIRNDHRSSLRSVAINRVELAALYYDTLNKKKKPKKDSRERCVKLPNVGVRVRRDEKERNLEGQ